MIKKLFAVVIIIGVIFTFLGRFFWIVLAIIVVIILIRLLADLFWWGKDNKKW